MDSQNYTIPSEVHAIPSHLLDLRPDSDIDFDLLHPKPVTNEKNIWFFWHNGFTNMHPYHQRTVRTWHRRFTKQGWNIRVLDQLSTADLLDVSDLGTFPRAFIDGTISGDYTPQHTSDLVRFPLLLKYGGVYADAGLIQIGDLDRLWNETVGNPASRYEFLSYNCGAVEERCPANYFLVARPNNPLLARCHQLLLALWAADGGKQNTEGMNRNPLLKGSPPMELTFEENGRTIGPEEGAAMLTDYIIQGQVLTQVMGLIDEEDGWNGPKYSAEHIYVIDYMEGSQLINDLTAWNGQKAFDLMSLTLPKDGEVESAEQKQARETVEACLRRSFGFKLATGLIVRVLGDTLSSLWRKHKGSDNAPGTYAHWLRHGALYWCQDGLPPRQEYEVIEPYKIGPLLRDST